MSHALTHWRRHVHRVGRDLGVPHKARMPLLALGLAGLGFLGYRRYTSFKVGDTVTADSSAFLSVPGVTAGQQVTAKVIGVSPDGKTLSVNPIVAGQQIPAAVSIAASAAKNTTPRLF